VKSDISRVDRVSETRPTRTAIILIFRGKQGCAIDNIDIDAIRMIVPVLISKWSFSASLLSDRVLERREDFFEFFFCRKFFCYSSLHTLSLRHVVIVNSPDFFLVLFSSRAIGIELIVQWIELVVVLMVVLCRIECRKWKYRRDEFDTAPKSS
jgi:hypothetical protein